MNFGKNPKAWANPTLIEKKKEVKGVSLTRNRNNYIRDEVKKREKKNKLSPELMPSSQPQYLIGKSRVTYTKWMKRPNKGTNERLPTDWPKEGPNQRTSERKKERTNERTKETTNEPTKEPRNERTTDRQTDRKKERTNKRTNERTNEGLSERVGVQTEEWKNKRKVTWPHGLHECIYSPWELGRAF